MKTKNILSIAPQRSELLKKRSPLKSMSSLKAEKEKKEQEWINREE